MLLLKLFCTLTFIQRAFWPIFSQTNIIKWKFPNLLLWLWLHICLQMLWTDTINFYVFGTCAICRGLPFQFEHNFLRIFWKGPDIVWLLIIKLMTMVKKKHGKCRNKPSLSKNERARLLLLLRYTSWSGNIFFALSSFFGMLFFWLVMLIFLWCCIGCIRGCRL